MKWLSIILALFAMFGTFVLSAGTNTTTTPAPAATTTTTPAPTAATPTGPVRKRVKIKNLQFTVIRRVTRNQAGARKARKARKNRSG